VPVDGPSAFVRLVGVKSGKTELFSDHRFSLVGEAELRVGVMSSRNNVKSEAITNMAVNLTPFIVSSSLWQVFSGSTAPVRNATAGTVSPSGEII